MNWSLQVSVTKVYNVIKNKNHSSTITITIGTGTSVILLSEKLHQSITTIPQGNCLSTIYFILIWTTFVKIVWSFHLCKLQVFWILLVLDSREISNPNSTTFISREGKRISLQTHSFQFESSSSKRIPNCYFLCCNFLTLLNHYEHHQ